MIRLTARLKQVVELIPQNALIADIGCDHGRLAVYYLQNNLLAKTIAADISLSSLEKTRALLKKCGLVDRCEIVRSDGFASIGKAADVYIIAGIGGMETISILKSAPDRGLFITQAMSLNNRLRGWLSENHFTISDERLVKEGRRFYEIIAFKRGEEKLSPATCEFGPRLMERKDKLLTEYVAKKTALAKAGLRKAEESGTPKAIQDKLELEKKIELYREVETWLSGI